MPTLIRYCPLYLVLCDEGQRLHRDRWPLGRIETARRVLVVPCWTADRERDRKGKANQLHTTTFLVAQRLKSPHSQLFSRLSPTGEGETSRRWKVKRMVKQSREDKPPKWANFDATVTCAPMLRCIPPLVSCSRGFLFPSFFWNLFFTVLLAMPFPVPGCLVSPPPKTQVNAFQAAPSPHNPQGLGRLANGLELFGVPLTMVSRNSLQCTSTANVPREIHAERVQWQSPAGLAAKRGERLDIGPKLG